MSDKCYRFVTIWYFFAIFFAVFLCVSGMKITYFAAAMMVDVTDCGVCRLSISNG
jgi:hypothetical protein